MTKNLRIVPFANILASRGTRCISYVVNTLDFIRGVSLKNIK